MRRLRSMKDPTCERLDGTEPARRLRSDRERRLRAGRERQLGAVRGLPWRPTRATSRPRTCCSRRRRRRASRFVAASGDTGSAGRLRTNATVGSLYVNYPASSPWVTGVGGTENTAFASQYLASHRDDLSGRGGCLERWLCARDRSTTLAVVVVAAFRSSTPRPTWQIGPGVDNPAYPNGGREVPDVSASADYNRYPYLVYDTDQLRGLVAERRDVGVVAAVGGSDRAR